MGGSQRLGRARHPVDLHSHSTCSDGVLTPTKLVERAAKRGVICLALTDHDTTEGIAEAQVAADRVGIELVPGVELSTWFDREIHILGYFLDPQAPEILAANTRQRGTRIRRIHQICERLAEIGVELDADEIIAGCSGNAGRPHVARALMAKGYVRTFDEAFRQYLGTNALAYIPASHQPAAEAIELIHRAGGVAVIAHPGVESLAEILPKLAQAGLDGVETEHPAHSKRTARAFRKTARELGLLSTGGSDFHRSKGKAELGDVGIDSDRLETLRARALRRQRALV